MRISSRNFILTLALVLCASVSHAYEVDNFTSREALTKDSLEIMDREVNRILDRAVFEANRESPESCSRAILRQEIVRWTRPEIVSLLEFWLVLTDDVQRTSIGLSESIYRGVSITESPGMWSAGIGRSFLLNGVVIGTDKIGHFFMQGLEYYKSVTEEKHNLEDVLRDEHGEDGIWGLTMTGVKSYADMSANFSGYKFWSQMFSGRKPYMSCDQGRRWVRERTFSWAEYVNPSWDEALNCSEYLPALGKRVASNMADRKISCPVDPGVCTLLNQLDHAEFYVNPSCR